MAKVAGVKVERRKVRLICSAVLALEQTRCSIRPRLKLLRSLTDPLFTDLSLFLHQRY